MNILVATAAAEEGVVTPRCEFAIRYTMVESGSEWTQRQGRARMHDRQFVSIIERGATDVFQLNKSKQEADNEYAAVVLHHQSADVDDLRRSICDMQFFTRHALHLEPLTLIA